MIRMMIRRPARAHSDQFDHSDADERGQVLFVRVCLRAISSTARAVAKSFIGGVWGGRVPSGRLPEMFSLAVVVRPGALWAPHYNRQKLVLRAAKPLALPTLQRPCLHGERI